MSELLGKTSASPEAISLIKSMLTIDPGMRPSAETCLQNAFFKTGMTISHTTSSLTTKPLVGTQSSKDDFILDLEQQLNSNYTDSIADDWYLVNVYTLHLCRTGLL